eukprot:353072-Chlamydomonas_euryale.AAC.2
MYPVLDFSTTFAYACAVQGGVLTERRSVRVRVVSKPAACRFEFVSCLSLPRAALSARRTYVLRAALRRPFAALRCF